MLVPDLMAAIYLGAFLFGLLFTVVAFVLGSLGDVVHVGDTHAALPSADHALPTDGVHADHATTHGPSILNLQVLAAFVTFFGGVGYALSLVGAIWTPFIFILALAAGLGAAAFIFWFLAKIIYGGQTPVLRDRDYDLPGTIARVTSSIRAGGTGEIVFEKGGRRRVEAARHEQAVAVPRDTEVVIVKYQNGIAYVEPTDEFFR
jgi:membrane protein implicated in regulation of membrane protease activity